MNRFILTEEERKNISNLHKKFVNEEDTQATSVQPGVFNQKVQELQNHLISLGHKIVADGKLGPKTLAAAQTALQTKTTQPTTDTSTDKNASTTVPPVVDNSSTTQDYAKYGLKKPEEYLNNPYLNKNSLQNQLGLKQ